MIDPTTAKARAYCTALGVHPKYEPIGPDHHYDAPMTEGDRETGAALAAFLGDLFGDVYSDPIHMTPAETWASVARALRIHGLQISDMPET